MKKDRQLWPVIQNKSEKVKKEAFTLHEQIVELETIKDLFGLSDAQELELRNKRVVFRQKWSELKD